MTILYSLLFLSAALATGLVSTWLLSRVDTLREGRRIGRRTLWLISIVAAAAINLPPPDLLLGGSYVASLILVMILSVTISVVHYRLHSPWPIYHIELALTWILWFGLTAFFRGAFLFEPAFGAMVVWFLFAAFGSLAIYPFRRRRG